MRKDLREVKIKIIHATNYVTKKTAILHRFNSYIRVLDGYGNEHLFRELQNALKYLIDHKYQIEIDM